jgi:hypothetical protein
MRSGGGGHDEIIIFAEGRWMLGDGCEPVPKPPTTSDGDRRAIFSRKSVDGGRTFGALRHVVGNRCVKFTAGLAQTLGQL